MNVTASDLVFVAGLVATCAGAWLVTGWAGVLVVGGFVAMTGGVLRQLLRRG